MTEPRDVPLCLPYRAPNLCEQLGIPLPRERDGQRAMDAILFQALTEHAGQGRRISYSRNRNYYTSARYANRHQTYNRVVGGVDRLASAGLLDNRIADNGGPSGWQSTFSLSVDVPEALLQEVAWLPVESVILRDSNKQPIDYAETRATQQMRREIDALNEAIYGSHITVDDAPHLSRRGLVIAGPGYTVAPFHLRLVRIFNINFGSGGRYYRGFWQGMPARDRALIRIDGEPTVEIDHPQIHPRIIYRREGRHLEGDAYDVPGHPPETRPLIKRAVNTAINARTETSAVRAITNEIHKFYGRPATMTEAAKLLDAVKKRHAPVSHWLHSGAGGRLQFEDAEMARRTQIALLKRGVVPLGIHDSFLVKKRHRGQLEGAMRDAFEAAFR